jgi:hypothetical protein
MQVNLSRAVVLRARIDATSDNHIFQSRGLSALHYSLNASKERQTRQIVWGSSMGEAARLTRVYPSTGRRVQLLHVSLVFFTLLGQRLGLGSISSPVRALTFLKTTRHVAPFINGARAEGYVVRILLVSLVQVLLVTASAIMHVVGG